MLIIGGRLVYGVSELRIRNWLGLTLPLIMSADIVTPQRGNARISDRLMGWWGRDGKNQIVSDMEYYDEDRERYYEASDPLRVRQLYV